MWRALAKGAGLAAFGHVPGGASVYRRITREVLGTQRSHVDKLSRAWPHYAALWRRHGIDLSGRRVWIHEGGWTVFPFVAGWLLTGGGVTVTNVEGRVLDRYTSHAVGTALQTRFPDGLVTEERVRAQERLRWASGAAAVISGTGGVLAQDVDPGRLPLESASMDLCHSGGTLEHYRPDQLRAFLAECFRVLRPGAVASHVFDHRDHLHHADRRWPFLAHLGLSDALYRPLCGHPLGYHSRLSPTEVVSLFHQAGFERIAVRRLVLPDRLWVDDGERLRGSAGLPRPLLARRFRRLSEDDLRTAAAHYLFRRPGPVT